MSDSLIGIKACVFDAYGTLFDFAAATRPWYDELGDQSATLTAWKARGQSAGDPARDYV